MSSQSGVPHHEPTPATAVPFLQPDAAPGIPRHDPTPATGTPLDGGAPLASTILMTGGTVVRLPEAPGGGDALVAAYAQRFRPACGGIRGRCSRAGRWRPWSPAPSAWC